MSTPGSNQSRQQGARGPSPLFSQAGATSAPRARKPTTTNIDNEINPAPRVPGQETFPRTTTDPTDRHLGFSSFADRASDTAQRPLPGWIAERERRMAELDESTVPEGYPSAQQSRRSPKGKGRVPGDASETDPEKDNQDEGENVGEESNPTTSTGKPRRKPIYYGVPPLPSASVPRRRRHRARAPTPEEEEQAETEAPRADEAPNQGGLAALVPGAQGDELEDQQGDKLARLVPYSDSD